MSNQDQHKRFEDWKPVDCNDCARYWDSSCDSVPQDTERLCNSFLATRKVVIPAKINSLEKQCERLRKAGIITDLVIIIHLLLHILGG